MNELNIKKIYCALLNKNEPETKKLLNKIKFSDEEIDDILEEQTPNFIEYEEYSVISLSFPTRETIKTGSNMLQITFIINNKELIIITNKESEKLSHAFNELRNIEEYNGTTSLLSQLIDILREDSIDIIEKAEDYIDENEKEIIEGKRNKKQLINMHNLREALHYIKSITRDDTQTIRELTLGMSSHVNRKYFSPHHEDRMNYLMNVTERLREAIIKNIDIFANLMTYKLDERLYKLTIIGSILIIPTVLSGFFGMNVTLPPLDFTGILILSGILSVITYFMIK